MRTVQNPVYEGYFADPFAFQHEGVWYAVGTGPSAVGDSRRIFPMLRSLDFATWEPLQGALIPPTVEGDCFWAPEVAFRDGRFYLYYSVGVGDKGHQLRVAVSEQPEGPYEDHGLLLNDPSCPFAIDPNPFQDVDGRWYMAYSRDFLDFDGSVRAGTALVVATLDDPLHLPTEYCLVARATQDWQRYLADRPMYESLYDWHTLEGPCMVRHGARYYCLYSGGNWQNVSYGIDYVTAEHPLGPWRATGQADAARVLRSVPGRVIGPGHNSVVVGPDEQEYVVYHAWDPEMTARRMCVDPLVWTDAGPVCEGPSIEARPLGRVEAGRP